MNTVLYFNMEDRSLTGPPAAAGNRAHLVPGAVLHGGFWIVDRLLEERRYLPSMQASGAGCALQGEVATILGEGCGRLVQAHRGCAGEQLCEGPAGDVHCTVQ